MRLAAALFGMVIVISPVFGQNTTPAPAPQALTYPRHPPKEWTAEFKDMKKRAARAQARQDKVNNQNKADIAMVNAEQSHLNATLPQGAGYDEALDLWLPGVQTPPAPTPPIKPEVKVEPKAKETQGAMPGETTSVE